MKQARLQAGTWGGLYRILATVLLGCLGCDLPAGDTPSTSGGDGSNKLALVFEVGGDAPDGEPVLLSASHALRLGSRVVVADRRGTAIVFIDSTGRLIRKVGQQGGGPGEFRVINWLGACAGDSLFVVDNALQRMTVLAPDGSYLRQYSIPGNVVQWSCAGQGVIAMLMGPKRLFGPSEMGRHPPDTAAVLRGGTSGDTTTMIAAVQIGEQRPVGLTTRIALGVDRLWIGTGESSYVVGYTLQGVARESLLVDIPRRKLSRREYELVIDRMMGPAPPAMRAMVLDAPMPEYHPRYGPIYAGPGGVAWVVTSMSTDSVTTLRAFASGGRVLGDVAFAHRVTVLAVGPDYLITTHDATDGGTRLTYHSVDLRTEDDRRR